jgi:hypothetical protein
MMTTDQLKELELLLAQFPARPAGYSYEGQGLAKSQDYHLHSICGGPMVESVMEKHYCLGYVAAKDEETAARLARLIEAAPLLLDEVTRLRGLLSGIV